MREILFRGKRADNGEWAYGYFTKSPSQKTYITETVAGCASPKVVDIETVGQFTGLTDKNGTKIFEGDILLVGGVQKVRVFFENGQFVIDHFALNLLCDRNLESKVIGNIHDNGKIMGE